MRKLIIFAVLLMVSSFALADELPQLENQRYISAMEAEEMLVGTWMLLEGRDSLHEDYVIDFGYQELFAELTEDGKVLDSTNPEEYREYNWRVFERESEVWLEVNDSQLDITEEFKVIFRDESIIFYYPPSEERDYHEVNIVIYVPYVPAE